MKIPLGIQYSDASASRSVYGTTIARFSQFQ